MTGSYELNGCGLADFNQQWPNGRSLQGVLDRGMAREEDLVMTN